MHNALLLPADQPSLTADGLDAPLQEATLCRIQQAELTKFSNFVFRIYTFHYAKKYHWHPTPEDLKAIKDADRSHFQGSKYLAIKNRQGAWLATLKATPQAPGRRFSIERDFGVDLDDLVAEKGWPAKTIWHLGRFAVDSARLRSDRSSLKSTDLLQVLLSHALEDVEADHLVVAESDILIYSLFRDIGITMQIVGEPRSFLGSPTFPVAFPGQEVRRWLRERPRPTLPPTSFDSDRRYDKNALYVSPTEQALLRRKRILLAGVGLGSIVAETALRLGFERLTLVDGDVVEPSNLNRQNYTAEDMGRPKVDVVAERLRRIHPGADIETHRLFLCPDNLERRLQGCDLAVNAIDFDALETPFLFDETCHRLGIPVVHPLNFGWAGAAFVVTPDSEQLSDSARRHGDGRFEITLIENMLQHLEHRRGLELGWLHRLLEDYRAVADTMTPPQLAVGSFLAAGLVTDLLFRLALGKAVKTYPEPYFLSAR